MAESVVVQKVIDAIVENRVKFEAFCYSLSDEQLNRPVPESTWVVRDFAAHLDTLDPQMIRLFESTAAENIGAMILGVGLYPFFGLKGILFPLVARAFGLLASIVGVMIVRCGENEDPMAALNRGYYVTSALAIVGFFFSARWLLAVDPAAHPEATSAWFYFFLCGVIGILMAQAFAELPRSTKN